MRDVDVLRSKLPGHTLCQSAQSELAHGEGGGLRIALDTRRGAGEQNAAAAARQHAPRRRLSHQKAAEGRDHESRGHLAWIDVYQCTRYPPAGIEHDQIRNTLGGFHVREQRFHLLGLSRIAGDGPRAGIGYQCRKLAHIARCQHHLSTLSGEHACQCSTQALPGTDDDRHF